MDWPKTEAGLLNIWQEDHRINDHQVKIIKKYCVHKWCIFTVITFVTDMSWFD